MAEAEKKFISAKEPWLTEVEGLLEQNNIETYQDGGVMMCKLDTKDKYDVFMKKIKPKVKNSIGWKYKAEFTEGATTREV